MKKILYMFVMLFWCLQGFAADRVTVGNCTPINTPNSATAKPCGPGYKGLQFKRTIVSCPGGQVTQSDDYDTSQCIPVGSGNHQDPCVVNPELCLKAPTPAGCPPGKHWTLQGLPYAHCVGDDISCPAGSILQHSAIGEPSCKVVSCPGNQVAQPDGSCACPAGLQWDGANCGTPPPVCANYTTTQHNACPAGLFGDSIQENTFDCNGRYITSRNISYTCAAVNCPQPSYEFVPCENGQSGTMRLTHGYVVDQGSCKPITDFDTSSCSAPSNACPAPVIQTGACPAGQTGNTTITNTYTLSPGATSCTGTAVTDYSGCSGATTPPSGGGTQPGGGGTQPSVTCPADAITTQNCPPGQPGSITTTTHYSVVNGVCSPSTSSNNGCIAPPGSCAPGGPQNYPICACDAGTTWNGSACVTPTCPPGGPQNYPICACDAGKVWNGLQCLVPQQIRRKFYCGFNPAAPGVGGQAAYGSFYPLDPNVDYVSPGTQGASWTFVSAGQYGTAVDSMWCNGSNGN